MRIGVLGTGMVGSALGTRCRPGTTERSVRDLGGLTAARGLEMYPVLWLSLRTVVGHNAFNIHLVD